MTRLALVVCAAALALAGAATAGGPPPTVGVAPSNDTHPGLPYYPSGSVVGAGLPLKAYTTIAPAVHLFGDTVAATLTVLADSRLVDPARVRASGGFEPYEPVADPTFRRTQIGRFTRLTWTWTLRCLTAVCVPVEPPSENYHVFAFRPARVDVVRPNGKLAYGITAAWPPIQVESRISPAVAAALELSHKYSWRYRLAPVAAPTYAVSPSLLFWLALALAGVLAVAGAAAAARWYAVVRPRRVTLAAKPGTALERALALIAWAHARGDETLQRKAFERVADELVVLPADAVEQLSRTARELAWSSHVPADEEISSFADQARETGRENGGAPEDEA